MSSLLHALRGNPVLTRHLNTTFTGPRLAGSFLLLGAWALLILGIIAEQSVRSGADYGSLPKFAFDLLLLLAFCFLLPIKVSGMVEGARLNKVFDQIVVTGVAPQRLLLGAWVAGICQAGLLCLFTLPFAAALVLFFEVPVLSLLHGYLTVLLYANLIIAITLATSLLAREWITAPVTIAVLITFSVLSFAPERDLWRDYPAFLAELSPARELFRAAGDMETLQRLANKQPALFFASFDPAWVWFVGWPLVLGACVLFMWIGPGHAFRPGLNNFGAVVLEGDRRRGLLAKLRGEMTRRVELGFFYENAAPWVGRWGPALRMALSVGLVVLAWGILLGLITQQLSWVSRRTEAFREDYALATIWLSLIPLGLFYGFMLMSRDETAVRQPWLRGAASRERSVWHASLFLLLCWAMMQAANLWNRHTEVGKPPVGATYDAQFMMMAGQALMLAVNGFLLSRVASRTSVTINGARIKFLLLLGALAGVPSIAMGVMVESGLAHPLWQALAAMAPVSVMLSRELGFADLGSCFAAFLLAHALLALVLLLRLRRLSLRLCKPAAMLLLGLGLAGGLPAQGQRLDPEAGTATVKVRDLVWGFDGLVPSRGGSYFTVELQNTGSAQASARVSVETDDGREVAAVEVVLQPGRRQRVQLHSGADFRITNSWWRRVPLVKVSADGQVWRSKPFDSQENGVGGTIGAQRNSKTHLFVGAGRGDINKLLPGSNLLQRELFAYGCRPQSLSSAVRDYRGITAVWLASEAFEQLRDGQERALLNYLAMGGHVFVWGEARPDQLESSAGFRALFADRQVDAEGRRGLGEAVSVVGADSLGMDLSRRMVGAGTLSWVAHPPLMPLMPERHRPAEVLSSRDEQRLVALLPEPIYPFYVDIPGWFARRDESRLVYMVILGVVYVVGFPLLLLLFGRGRERRRRLWWMLGIVPLVSVVPLVGVDAWSETWISSGEAVQLDLYEPGSSYGLRSMHLRACSAGRRAHDLRWRAPRAAEFYSQDRFGEMSPREVTNLGWVDGEQRLRLELRPGGYDEFHAAARIRLQQPFQLEVRRAGRDRHVRVRIPEGLSHGRIWLLETGQNRGLQPLEKDADGWVQTLVRGAVRSNNVQQLQMNRNTFVRLRRASRLQGTHFLLLESAPDAEPFVQGEGMRFERLLRFAGRPGDPAPRPPYVKVGDRWRQDLRAAYTLVPVNLFR